MKAWAALTGYLIVCGMAGGCKHTGEPVPTSREQVKITKVEAHDATRGSLTAQAKLRQAKFASPPVPAIPPLYKIKPDDVVEVAIWGEDTTRRALLVGPDGRISFDLAGEVVASGLTFPELRDVLTQRLQEFYWEPRVIVNGASYPGNAVTVIGQVGKPGRYPITGVTRLLDLLAMAGLRQTTTGEGAVGAIGVSSFGGVGSGTAGETADLRSSMVVRDDKDLEVDFYKLMVEKDFTQNIMMLPGDTVWIPSLDLFKDKIYVIGEIHSVIIPFTGKMSFLEAISFCGDVNDATARDWRILIIRGRLSKNPEVLPVDYAGIRIGRTKDIYLKAGDVVYVTPEAGVKVDRIAGKMILPFFNVFTGIINAQRAAQHAGSTVTR